MSHTDRINEDEEDLDELKNQVNKISQLKEGYNSQREQINSLKELILQLKDENEYLKKRQKFPTKVFQDSPEKLNHMDYCSVGNAKNDLPRSFRMPTQQQRIGIYKSNSQFIKTQQTINDHSFYHKNQIIDGFVQDLKLELHEKDHKISEQKQLNRKLKQKYKQSKEENQKLRIISEKVIEKNDQLVRENSMLKEQIRLQTELRYIEENKLKQKEIIKGNFRLDWEKEFIKMDQIYQQVQFMKKY